MAPVSETDTNRNFLVGTTTGVFLDLLTLCGHMCRSSILLVRAAHDDRNDSPAIARFGLLCVRSLLAQNVGVSLKSTERLIHKTCAILPHFCLLASLSLLQITCVSDSAKGVLRCSSLSFFQ